MQGPDTTGGANPASLRAYRNRVVGTAMGVALVNGAGLQFASAQGTYGASPMELPPVSVEGAQGGQQGYQVDQPANNKLTAPLVSTPESVIEVPRKLLDDQGV